MTMTPEEFAAIKRRSAALKRREDLLTELDRMADIRRDLGEAELTVRQSLRAAEAEAAMHRRVRTGETAGRR